MGDLGTRGTNLTLRQLAPLFGVSKSAADCIISIAVPSSSSGPADGSVTVPCSLGAGPWSPPATTRLPSGRRTTAAPPTTRSSSTRIPGLPLWSPAVARQPQRLQGMGTVRSQRRHRLHHRDRRRRLPGHRSGHPAPPRARTERTGRLEGRAQHFPPPGPRPWRALLRLVKAWEILRDRRLKGDGVHHAMMSGIARLHTSHSSDKRTTATSGESERWRWCANRSVFVDMEPQFVAETSCRLPIKDPRDKAGAYMTLLPSSGEPTAPNGSGGVPPQGGPAGSNASPNSGVPGPASGRTARRLRSVHGERGAAIILAIAAVVGIFLNWQTNETSKEVAKDQLAHSKKQDELTEKSQASLINLWPEYPKGGVSKLVVINRSLDPVRKVFLGMEISGQAGGEEVEAVIMVPIEAIAPCSRAEIAMNGIYAPNRSGKNVLLESGAEFKDYSLSFVDSNGSEWERPHDGTLSLVEGDSGESPREKFKRLFMKKKYGMPHLLGPESALSSPAALEKCGES